MSALLRNERNLFNAFSEIFSRECHRKGSAVKLPLQWGSCTVKLPSTLSLILQPRMQSAAAVGVDLAPLKLLLFSVVNTKISREGMLI